MDTTNFQALDAHFLLPARPLQVKTQRLPLSAQPSPVLPSLPPIVITTAALPQSARNHFSPTRLQHTQSGLPLLISRVSSPPYLSTCSLLLASCSFHSASAAPLPCFQFHEEPILFSSATAYCLRISSHYYLTTISQEREKTEQAVLLLDTSLVFLPSRTRSAVVAVAALAVASASLRTLPQPLLLCHSRAYT